MGSARGRGGASDAADDEDSAAASDTVPRMTTDLLGIRCRGEASDAADDVDLAAASDTGCCLGTRCRGKATDAADAAAGLDAVSGVDLAAVARVGAERERLRLLASVWIRCVSALER